MFRLFFYIIIFALAIWAGLLIKDNPGYALFAYKHWTVEMPLWTAAMIAAISFIIFYYLIRLCSLLIGSNERLRHWITERQRHKSYNLTNQGLIALIEGHWREAERLLKQGIKSSNLPLINYLGAAWTAQEQGAIEKRDQYLREAWQQFPEEEFAIGLTQAKLQLRQQQYELALASLRHLYLLHPKHPQILKLQYIVYFKLLDWKKLAELVNELRKQKIINNVELMTLEASIAKEQIQQAGQEKMQIQDMWKNLSSTVRKNPNVLFVYCQQLLKRGEADKAAELISDYLNKNWDDNLINLYGQIKTTAPEQQLTVGEKWLNMCSDNPHLLLALGRLAIQAQLWGKARDYLGASIKLSPNPVAYEELAILNEQLNDIDAANKLYREGLIAATDNIE